MGRVQDCQRAQLQEYCKGTGICWDIGPESSQTLEVSLVIVTVCGFDSMQEVAIMIFNFSSLKVVSGVCFGQCGILFSYVE